MPAPSASPPSVLRLEKLEAGALLVQLGPFTLKVGRAVLHKLVAQARSNGGSTRLDAFEAASADLSDVEIEGPLVLPAASRAAGAWSLAPLAAAGGVIRAEIVDAHLGFDAQVTVPIRQGRIAFNDATVEHVGPDSRMGASKLGIHIDAPNGRSYLYQFSTTPMAGVEYEKRGPLPGPWGGDRGSLQLQAFGESLLQQVVGAGAKLGVTAQVQTMLGRTSVQGDLQLGEGKLAAPGVHVELTGSMAGSNRVRLHSGAVGRGITAEMNALSVRAAALDLGGMQMAFDSMSGTLVVHLAADASQLRFSCKLATATVTGLRVSALKADGSG